MEGLLTWHKARYQQTRGHCCLTWRTLLQASRSLAAHNVWWRRAGGGAFGLVSGVPGNRLLLQPHHPHHRDRSEDLPTGQICPSHTWQRRLPSMWRACATSRTEGFSFRTCRFLPFLPYFSDQNAVWMTLRRSRALMADRAL